LNNTTKEKIEMEKIFFNKEEQLIYMGASVASGCWPCTKYHLKRSSEAGLTDIELANAFAIAISIRDKATRSMESLAKNRNKAENIEEVKQKSLSRSDILVGIAATYSVNFPLGLETYLSLGRDNGLHSVEFKEIIGLSKSVICKARAHTDMVSDRMGILPQAENNDESDCCSSRDCK